jgi:hypothetical protein
LRGQALSDDRTIGLINSDFVPVWVDTTRSGIPDTPAFRDLKEWFDTTTSSFATGWIATSFYLGSVVLTPDGTERINESKLPWPWTWKEAKAEDYLEMLEGALRRWSRSSARRP